MPYIVPSSVNVNKGSVGIGANISNGSISISGSINDYPTANVTSYQRSGIAERIGAVKTFNGLTFMCISSSVKELPPGNPIARDCTKEITSQYVHVSKSIYETPINVRKFLATAGATPAKRSESFIWVPIGALVKYASERAKGSVSVPSFLVKLSASPSVEESVTIRDLVDPMLAVRGLILDFSGSTLKTKRLGGGSVGGSIVSDVSYGKGVFQGYKNTSLTWEKADEEVNTDRTYSIIKKSDEDYSIYEGSKDPHIAPTDRLPRDLSVMFDVSGITKDFSITVYKRGEIEAVLTGQFGYAQAALELVEDPLRANAEASALLDSLSGDPTTTGNALHEIASALSSGAYGYPDGGGFDTPVWRCISAKYTKHVWTPFTVNIQARVKDEKGVYKPVTVPDAYQPLLNPRFEVLTKEISTGWELKRFSAEDAQTWDKGSIQSWIRLKAAVVAASALTDSENEAYIRYSLYQAKLNLEKYLYRKIPIYEEVGYAAIPYARYYKDADDIQWTVEEIPENEINPKSSNTEPIPVLFPDPSWAPSLMISARSRFHSSVAEMGNPDFNPYARSYYEINASTLISGKEEYELTKYTILPSANTKPALGGSYGQFGDVGAIISAIGGANSQPGTLNPRHEFMQVTDQGIPGASPGNVNVSVPIAFPQAAAASGVDRYSTTSSIRSAQDHSFTNSVTVVNSSVSQGRPPEARLRRINYEVNNDSDSIHKDTATFISSNVVSVEYTPSISVPGARNLSEAIQGAKHLLKLSMIQASSGGCQLSFTKSNVKYIVGSSVSIPASGRWVVKSYTASCQYSDGEPFPQPLQIEAGTYLEPNIRSSTIKIDSADNNNDNQPAMEVDIDANIPSIFAVDYNAPTNFGRWL